MSVTDPDQTGHESNRREAVAPRSRARAAARSRLAVRRFVERRWFQRSIVGLIVFNAIILGLETYPAIMVAFGPLLSAINTIVVAVFVVELALRL